MLVVSTGLPEKWRSRVNLIVVNFLASTLRVGHATLERQMNTSLSQRWRRMPWLIRLILIISVFDFLIACVGAAALLTGILEPGRSTVPPLTVTAVLLVSGTLGYGIAMEHRYPRPLATIAFAAQPFASGEFSWRVAISSILCLVVAVWFLYWNDKITDYYIILSDHARERHRSLVRSG